MEQKDLIDRQAKPEQSPFDRRKKYALTIFFLLDIVCFIRAIDQIKLLLFYGFEVNLFLLTNLILLLSLLASAVLFIIRKKAALIIYYVQFPFRIIFLTLSFGFLIDLFGLANSSDWYKILLVLILILEFLRLLYTIALHRDYN